MQHEFVSATESEFLKSVWDLVIQNERLIRREVRKFLPRDRAGEFDELYSDVVYGRCVDVMRTYREGRGAKPITHLCVNLRWYAYKWVNRRRSTEFRDSLFDHGDKRNHAIATFSEDASIGIEVHSVLATLPEDMANLLEWSIVKEYSVKEIADHLGVKQSQVREDLAHAMDLVRDYQGLMNLLFAVNGASIEIQRDGARIEGTSLEKLIEFLNSQQGSPVRELIHNHLINQNG
jgi:RNA polymerase sigma factor (sigma-70 family)